MFLSSTKIFDASQTNSVDPDQTAPRSTLFAPILMLNKKQTLSNVVILLAFKFKYCLLLRCYGTIIQLSSNKTTPRFQLRLTSHNYAFMRCRLYSKLKVISYICILFIVTVFAFLCPQTLKKLKGHIDLGLYVRPFVCL